jgi:hypothetical protein
VKLPAGTAAADVIVVSGRAGAASSSHDLGAAIDAWVNIATAAHNGKDETMHHAHHSTSLIA